AHRWNRKTSRCCSVPNNQRYGQRLEKFLPEYHHPKCRHKWYGLSSRQIELAKTCLPKRHPHPSHGLDLVGRTCFQPHAFCPLRGGRVSLSPTDGSWQRLLWSSCPRDKAAHTAWLKGALDPGKTDLSTSIQDWPDRSAKI